MERVAKYFTVFASSMFKFVFGPIAGQAGGLSMWETALFTIAGMMASVLIFSLLGEKVRVRFMQRFTQARKKFSPRTRRIVTFWKSYGLAGVAFLTPVIFSPIVGTILALSFGEAPRRIVPAMFFSAVFWGIALTVAMHFIGHQVLAVVVR